MCTVPSVRSALWQWSSVSSVYKFHYIVWSIRFRTDIAFIVDCHVIIMKKILKRIRMSNALTLALLLIPTLAVAVLIGSWEITGSLTATEGASPEQIDVWDLAITTDDNVSTTVDYDNPDGVKSGVSVSLVDNLESINGCTYEAGKDIRFFLDTPTSSECELLVGSPCLIDIVEGLNPITVVADPHPNRCGLNGTYAIGFVI